MVSQTPPDFTPETEPFKVSPQWFGPKASRTCNSRTTAVMLKLIGGLKSRDIELSFLPNSDSFACILFELHVIEIKSVIAFIGPALGL